MPKNIATVNDAHWTLDAYVAHNEALRRAEKDFQVERDRRYKEVDDERANALKIKDKADANALALQSETQKYKDEKANELRAQIESERGLYVRKEELIPLSTYITEQRARNEQVQETKSGKQVNIDNSTKIIAVILTAAALLSSLLIYQISRTGSATSTPIVCTTNHGVTTCK